MTRPRPTRCWLYGYEVGIKFRRVVKDGEEDLCGKWVTPQNQIWISTRNTEAEQRSTLYHELRHAMVDLGLQVPPGNKFDEEEWTLVEEKLFFAPFVDPRNAPLWEWIRLGTEDSNA